MASILRHSRTRRFPSLWSTATLLVASLLVMLGSLDAYLFEDDGTLGRAAHKASLMISLTYEGMYITAMVIFSLVVFFCLQLASLWLTSSSRSVAWLVAIGAFTLLAAFGGLLLRQPLIFLLVGASFVLLLGLLTYLGYRWAHFLGKPKDPSSLERATSNGPSLSLLLALVANLFCAIGHLVSVQLQAPELYRATFSGLGGGLVSEYVTFTASGTVLTVLAGVILIVYEWR